jgi:hypothetical protein
MSQLVDLCRRGNFALVKAENSPLSVDHHHQIFK